MLVENTGDVTPVRILLSTELHTEFPSTFELIFGTACTSIFPFFIIKNTAALRFLMLHCTIQQLFSTVLLSLYKNTTPAGPRATIVECICVDQICYVRRTEYNAIEQPRYQMRLLNTTAKTLLI